MATELATLTGTYNIDPSHSRIGFSVRHAMVTKVHGTFDDFEGHGYFDPEYPSKSSLTLTIKATSIDTRNADRDAHLRSSDFFDMDTYPLITFASTSVEKLHDELYRVTGDLIIKGIAKGIVMDLAYTGAAIDPYKNHRIGFEGTTTVDRGDWGLIFNAALETGGVLVGENVTLEFDVSAIRMPKP
jgi:polyisoprenoid-binding protein YceI